MYLRIIITWFPIAIFSGAMVLPVSNDLALVPMFSLPFLVAIWLFFAVCERELAFPQHMGCVVITLVLVQLSMAAFGGVAIPNNMYIGLVWVLLGFGVWSLMYQRFAYADLLYHIYLWIAFLWACLGFLVWLGVTDDGAPIFLTDNIVLTQMMQPKVTGPFFNSNVFCILMLCAWGMATGLLLRLKVRHWLYALMSFLFLTAVFVGMSRGTWLAWLVVISFLLWGLVREVWTKAMYIRAEFSMTSSNVAHLTNKSSNAGDSHLDLGNADRHNLSSKFHKQLLRTREIKIILWLLGSSLLAWLCAGVLVTYVGTGEGIEARAAQLLSAGVRVTLYTSVFEVWKEHWLFGVGLGNLAAHYLTGQAAAFAYLPDTAVGIGATRNAHNHWLHILAETGVVGLLAWGLVSFVLLRGFWTCRFDVTSKAWWAFAIAMMLWVQGLFNVSMIQPIPFFLFCMCLGLAMAFQAKYSCVNMFTLPKRYIVLFLAVLMIVLGVKTIEAAKNGQLFVKMLENRTPDNVATLMDYELTYPLLIQQVAEDTMLRASTRGYLLDLQPQIKKALAMEEWPKLYQALFYTYTLQENWGEACKLGKFIQQQHWEYDMNEDSYVGACLGEKRGVYKLGWKLESNL